MRQPAVSRRAGHLRRMGRRALLAVALGIGLTLLAAAPAGPLRALIPVASAHAYLLRASPAAESIARTPPQRVRLEFSEAINPSASRVLVVDAVNREVDDQNVHIGGRNDTVMTVTLPALPAGTYVVVWRAESADDGHITGDSYSFRIARPDGSVPPIPAHLPNGQNPGAVTGAGTLGAGALDGPTVAQALASWLAFLALTFWVGGVIWETWILPPALPPTSMPTFVGRLVRRMRGRRACTPSPSAQTGGPAMRPAVRYDPDVLAEARLSARRFRRLAPYALALLLVAGLGIVLAGNADLAGEWSGAFTPYLLRATLFGSRFGLFWLARQGIAIVALGMTLLATRRGWPRWHSDSPGAGEEQAAPPEASESTPESATAPLAIPNWRQGVWEALRRIPWLPQRLVAGWRGLTWLGRVEALLGGGLLVAFALSGHAAAVPPPELGYALSVDILHLLGSAAWVGGLFYISIVLLPALRGLSSLTRARILAMGLPEFSAVALVAAVTLAATGSLSATIHLTSPLQVLTTAYGRVLAIKIELFLVMALISAYHAFALRPQLAGALSDKSAALPVAAVASQRAMRSAPPVSQERLAIERETLAAVNPAHVPDGTSSALRPDATAPASRSADRDDGEDSVNGRDGPGARGDGATSERAARLAARMETWLRREAMLGAAILLCVALLAAFAGTLAPPAIPAAGAARPSLTSNVVSMAAAPGNDHVATRPVRRS